MTEIPIEKGLQLRRSHLEETRRVVVKVGSAVLTTAEGLNTEVLASLAAEISWLNDTGREVILVSSGAVAAGRRKLGLGRATISMREKQALAAAGQASMMHAYEGVFAAYDQAVAQVLLTHSDLSHRHRYLNVRNTLLTLLEWDVLPIINENDPVSVDELRFGDNDTLSAMVANLVEADLLVLLTDVDCLYTGNPCTNPEARPIQTVSRVDAAVEEMAGNVCGLLGTGGMRSKILAAKSVSLRGCCSFVGSGRRPGVIRDLFGGEPVGTFFLPQEERLHSRKHWIAFTLRPKGYLVLDDGACRALVGRGKSLLPSGILEVRGKFEIGDPVHCLDRDGRAIAAGLVAYSAEEIEKIQGARTNQIEELLGHKDGDEVIHRDNLVLL